MEMSISGNWIFLNKNKNAKLKKKEAILLSFTSESTISNGNNSSSTYAGLTSGKTLLFEIDQLKNKEIILIDEEIENYSDDLVLPYTSTTRTKYTLVQK
jgi:hypothetical protein